MVMYRMVGGVNVPLTSEEEAARLAEEALDVIRQADDIDPDKIANREIISMFENGLEGRLLYQLILDFEKRLRILESKAGIESSEFRENLRQQVKNL